MGGRLEEADRWNALDCATTNGIGSRTFCLGVKDTWVARRKIIGCSFEAVLYRFRTGCPWRDLPARFGHFKTVHQRFSRWAKSGVFERIFKLLSSDPDNEYMMIDATIVRAHQHSAGARKKTARKPSADRAED